MPKMTAYRAIYPGPQRQTNASAPERTERAAMAYGEFARGTVQEYEAMESTVLNRLASGHKYWVDRDKRGEPLSEHNVITAKDPTDQYQAVRLDNRDPRDRMSNYQKFLNGVTNDRGTYNAIEADQNLRRTGKPTTDAVSFIVHEDGSPPTDEEIMRLGPNLDKQYEKIGRVYLYKLKR